MLVSNRSFCCCCCYCIPVIHHLFRSDSMTGLFHAVDLHFQPQCTYTFVSGYVCVCMRISYVYFLHISTILRIFKLQVFGHIFDPSSSTSKGANISTVILFIVHDYTYNLFSHLDFLPLLFSSLFFLFLFIFFCFSLRSLPLRNRKISSMYLYTDHDLNRRTYIDR